MRFGLPWRAKGSEGAAYAPAEETAGFHRRLEGLTRHSDRIPPPEAAAYAPPHLRAPVVSHEPAPPSLPAPPALPPELERALAEIADRQRMLADAPAPLPLPPAPPATPRNLGGLEQQLRKITAQIETLRAPGVTEAIQALREELSEIGRALNQAMPRRALDEIEFQIHELARRIAEDRQAGADAGALAGIERRLSEVRDALHGLTPAENLVGYTDAVAKLAQKIDLIVAERDPATLRQFESAVVALRGMVDHVASNETVGRLAAQVQALSDKIERIGHPGPEGDVLANLALRIDALTLALDERAHDAALPARLETLVASLADKIDRIQNAREPAAAGQLEAIERRLADLLGHIEQSRGPGANDTALEALREDVVRTHETLDAMQDTLGLVVDRLASIGHDIRAENPLRAAEDEVPLELLHPVGAEPILADAPTLAPDIPPMPAAPAIQPPRRPAPRRVPAPAPLTIEQGADADQPLEPGSGPPPARGNPAARIAASEAALGGALPATPRAGHSSFIAAARRAAQAASQEPDSRRSAGPAVAAHNPSSVRGKMMKRVKSLFIAASIVALVVGSLQIGGSMLGLGSLSRLAHKSAPVTDDKTAANAALEAAEDEDDDAPLPAAPTLPKLAEKQLQPARDSGLGLTPPAAGTDLIKLPPAAIAPPPAAAAPAAAADPRQALTAPSADITGSIPSPKAAPAPVAPQPPAAPDLANLPPSISASLRMAAAAGDAAAAYEIATRYAEGRGVPANMEEAARWFERAAAKGLVPAQFRYASQLEKGLGVKKDLEAARRLYLAAAAKGNAKAMHNLAVLYAEGPDGKPDYETAAKWFQSAARHGVADSQYNLGILYARGIGVGVDLAESYKWFALAAAGGDPEAGKKRDEVAAHLDAAALAGARRAVESFSAEPQPAAAITVPAPAGGWDKAAAPAHGKPPRTALNLGKR